MFFKKLLGKKKGKGDEEEGSALPSGCAIPSPLNLAIIGCMPPHKTTLLEALCGEKRAERPAYFRRANVDFKKKKFNVAEDKAVTLSMWGIPGNENFWAVAYPYCKGAHGVILYYDSSDKESFDCVKSLVERNSKILLGMNTFIRVVEVLEKKIDSAVAPKKELSAITKKIGAGVLKCCFEEVESVSAVLRSVVIGVIKKYISDPDAVGRKGVAPSNPTETNESPKEPDGPKEGSPASLISLLKSENETVKEVKRNEDGLFGEYSEAYKILSYNVAVLGSPKIGKSCLCARYLQNENVGWLRKSPLNARPFNLPNGILLKLRMTEGEFPKSEADDAAGYTKAHAVLLCYDITDRNSFDALKEAVKAVKEHAIPGAVLMVVGLRHDDKDHVEVGGSEGSSLAEENGMIFRECSAMGNAGVSLVFSKVLHELQRIDCFALPISFDDANRTLPPSVIPAEGKKDKGEEEEEGSSALLDKILSDQIDNSSMCSCCEHTVKIDIVGEIDNGKTSLYLRYTDGTWTDRRICVPDVDFKIKVVHLPNGMTVRFQVFDADTVSFRSPSYRHNYKGMDGIVVCCDPTFSGNVQDLKECVSRVESRVPKNVPIMLVGTKSDLPPDADSVAAIREYADSINVPLMMCSAKTGDGVDDVFIHITERILKEMY